MFILIGLFGGLGLFLYGMQIASEGLQLAAGRRLKIVLEVLTKNRFVAVLLGIVITVLIQSSSATTVILVGLVNASLMDLAQTIGVTLGSNVGTTLTVQLIAFKVSDYALLMIGAAVIIILVSSKNKRLKYSGQVLLGFGLVFFGMKVMSDAVYPLKSNVYFRDLLVKFGEIPILGVLVSAAFTGIIQSSAATIGLLLSLANQDLITAQAAIPLMLGANIGTCATALLSCIGTSREAKRVALVHILMKIFGVILIMPFLGFLTELSGVSSGTVTRQIANSHTLFNIYLLFLFFPFVNPMARLATRLIPGAKVKPHGIRPLYLADRLLETPELAVAQATKEVERVARNVRNMVIKSMELVETGDEKLMEQLMAWEEETDELSRIISVYLTDLAEHELTPEQSGKDVALLHVVNDLENIGDIIENIARLSEKKTLANLEFSPEGKAELARIHQAVLAQLETALAALTSDDKEGAKQAIKDGVRIRSLGNELRLSHINRLIEKKGLSRNSSMIHLDLLNYYQRISDHAGTIAHAMLGYMGYI